MDDEDEEYGDEEDDNNSQTGFSEYMVKGTVVSAFKTPKTKKKQ